MGEIDEPLQVMRNTLLLNRGDLTFAEIAYAADLPATDWSWAPVFVDVDLDGFERGDFHEARSVTLPMLRDAPLKRRSSA